MPTNDQRLAFLYFFPRAFLMCFSDQFWVKGLVLTSSQLQAVLYLYAKIKFKVWLLVLSGKHRAGCLTYFSVKIVIKILSGKFGADHCDQLPATSRCQSRLLAIPPGGITRTTPGSRERVKYFILLFFLSLCVCAFQVGITRSTRRPYFWRETSQMFNIFISSVHLLGFFWGISQHTPNATKAFAVYVLFY